jgi:predicted ATPase
MDLELRPLNVLIGANGAGKSNLISFFKLLNEMMAGRLQQHIGTTGRARSLLHFGPKVTTEISAKLEFDATVQLGIVQCGAYSMRLAYAAGDSLAFVQETLESRDGSMSNAFGLGSGHAETRIGVTADSAPFGMPTIQRQAKVLRDLLNQFGVYHFHDTSPTASVRQYCYVEDNRSLLFDAGNLAAFLRRLREENGGVAYRRIVSTIRLIAPFFDDFQLEPSGPRKTDIILNWRDKSTDQVFGPHQLSDGTLRAMSLIALLLQPEGELPCVIVVDEPELGLHPYALNVIAALFKKASHHTQVIVSTQSSSFVDSIEPEDVIVVSREGRESKFTRPDPARLDAWLEEYSLGEVWEKNVIGGGPH